ncbi:MAG: hypothetical protein JNK60_05225, partial [Acidobacteria bacterium]|nr:hypothetical protein [Acidobacteriota bacterium]
AEALRRLGRHDEAAVLTRSVLAGQGAPDDVLRAVVTDPQGAGSRAAAAFRLARLRARESRGWVSPYAIASAELAVGNEAGALVELERGLAERDPMLRRIDKDVTFEALRERPGFRNLIAPTSTQD